MSSSTSPAPPGIDPATWQLLLSLPKGCYPHLIDGVKNDYSYAPHLSAGIVFDILFGLALAGHLYRFARFRQWTSILVAIGSLTEIIGWAGRTWSSQCPYNHDAFLMQITTLIIAPTFYSAALYVVLGQLITLLGPSSSALSPKWYTIIFCTCDVVSLVIQAVGGGLASTESGKIDGNTKPGTNIMVAGIVFQMFTMTLFALSVLDFMRRTSRAHTVFARPVKLVLLSLAIAFTMIYIRSIYRTIELAQGWTGNLITHEGYFVGLDAALMVVMALDFLALDPTILFREARGERSKTEREVANESPL